MKYCFGCDGKFGAEDGIASSRKSSYRRLQRDPEVLPTDLRVIQAFFESHGESYSSPLCLDCALFRVLGYKGIEQYRLHVGQVKVSQIIAPFKT